MLSSEMPSCLRETCFVPCFLSEFYVSLLIWGCCVPGGEGAHVVL